MRALGRFRRFTLFHHLSHLPITLAVFFVCFCWCLGLCGVFVLGFVLGFGFGCVCCFVVFLFPVLQVSRNLEFFAQIRPRLTDKA